MILPLPRFMSIVYLLRLFACACLCSGVVGASVSTAQEQPPLNQIVGTQAIGGPYQFTDAPYLLEVAREIESMGSNLIKFALSPVRYAGRPYRMEKVAGVESMLGLLQKHPIYQELMGMDFMYYHIWANPYCNTRWQNGVDSVEEAALYSEFYELSAYLLNEYKGSRKVFFLGHWEGDWLLSGKMDPKVDPTPERIAGFAQYLNIRQRAVDDARRKYADQQVWIYHYTEVNQVMKGLDGARPTLTNAVLPLVDVDFVSYSCYDALHQPEMRQALHRALDHIESQLKPRADILGKRVFVGEYAIKAASVKYDPIEHDRRNREATRAILEWGCPFALYWQFYCNEPRGDSYEGFWLVDHHQQQSVLYQTFKDYYANMNGYIAETRECTGKSPSDDAIRAFAIEQFE